MQREHREERKEEHHLDSLERKEDYPHDDTIVYHPSRTTKILISPGTGAGWVTWAPRQSSDAFRAWMLCYEPLIRGLERREHQDKLEDLHRDFHHDARVKFGVERIVCARVGDLEVCEVRGPFEIHEIEGRESLVEVVHRGARRNIII